MDGCKLLTLHEKKNWERFLFNSLREVGGDSKTKPFKMNSYCKQPP
jgi:hypothetical protein